ncbi:MAG TPA: ABC transporter permease [Pyrinomonadaceae bacterium]|nr:ABC transporter permease [Pyrinomonadaceae bacterium]
MQDLRYAIRTLLRNRSFTIVATLMLALGIGANTAVFSVVLSVLIRPLPYDEADRLVWLTNENQDLGVKDAFLNPADILDFREQSQCFDLIAAWGTLPVNLYGAKTPERVESIFVTSNFFRTLGVRPKLGRDFAGPDEPENSVIISHALWLRQFGGEQSVIGRKISFGVPATDYNNSSVIVGVLPEEANFPARIDVFSISEISRADLERGGSHNWRTIGRLKPGVTVEQAQAEMSAMTLRQAELYPDTNRGWQVHIDSFREHLFGNSRPALWSLLAAVGMVLLIACANVANLQLGRSFVRRREVAVRLALGAGRLRLVRQSVIENLLLSGLGCAAGLVVAIWCLSFVQALGPESIPRLRDASLSLPALFFAMGVALLCAITIGLVSVFQSSRLNLNDVLKNAQSAGTTDRHSNRIRQTLVVGQIALALVLLTGAGLIVKSFRRLQAVDTGMRTDHLVTAGLSLSFADFPNGSPKRTQLYQQAVEKLSALPGVVSVGAISHLPLGGRTMQLPFTIPTQSTPAKHDERVADYRVVTPSFFQTTGVELKKGRLFAESDRERGRQVFIVNEAFVRTYLPAVEPVGVRLDGESALVKGEIVGVVASIKHRGLELDAQPALYVSYLQSSTFPIMNFVVKTQTDPSSLLGPVRRELEQLEPRAVVFNVRTFDEFMSDAVAPRRFNLWLFAGFGFLAVLLAAAGIYATINFAVAQRNREIGIRVALGAQKSAVMKLILREAGILIAAGLIIGVAASFAISQWIKSLLFDVSATDPFTYLIAGFAVICIALYASWIPARRATKVDPISTLRG